MDSITQAVLGAAVGEAVLGRNVGNKAALWGALGGTIPDLDVLANPFLTEVQSLAFHRGPTHSLLFSVVVAPLVGYLIYRIHRRAAGTWRAWTLLMFLALVTHPILDCFTVYGTQILWPFSRYPVSFDSIFIIDPLYTVPLTVGLLLSLRMRRTARRRAWPNALGLALSTGYLLFTLVNKAHVHTTFEHELAQQDVSYERLLTAPMPFANALWMGLADQGDSVYVGLYSIFDADDHIASQAVETQRHLLDPFRDDAPAQRLLWFSKGWYQMAVHNDTLLLHDLRFGRLDGWQTEEAPYVFTFKLMPHPRNSGLSGFRQLAPPFDTFSGDRLRSLFSRTFGEE